MDKAPILTDKQIDEVGRNNWKVIRPLLDYVAYREFYRAIAQKALDECDSYYQSALAEKDKQIKKGVIAYVADLCKRAKKDWSGLSDAEKEIAMALPPIVFQHDKAIEQAKQEQAALDQLTFDKERLEFWGKVEQAVVAERKKLYQWLMDKGVADSCDMANHFFISGSDLNLLKQGKSIDCLQSPEEKI